MVDPPPDIMGSGHHRAGGGPAADVVDGQGVLVAVLVVPPQAARVKARAAVSAAAPERANVFMWGVLLELW